MKLVKDIVRAWAPYMGLGPYTALNGLHRSLCPYIRKAPSGPNTVLLSPYKALEVPYNASTQSRVTSDQDSL